MRAPGQRGPRLLALVVAAVVAAPAAGQSTLERTPNLGGVWSSPPGVLHFHVLHRFQVTPAPARKVLNSPTMLLAAGLPAGVTAGARYASSSILVAGEPNEWELFGRWSPSAVGWRGPVEVVVEAGRNMTADSWDGELAAARDVGPIRLLAGARAFSSFAGSGDARWAALGGVRLRLHRYVALSGDVAQVMDGGSAADPDAAWGAGLQLAIPFTPHSLSLQVTNANTTTLQGASIGAGDRRWGFEFTIPVTLSRYFGGRERPTVASGGSADASADASAAVVEMDNRLRYLPATVRIRAGETVEWRNTSDVIHTVTADPEAAVEAASVRLPPGAAPFDSGDLRPGESFSHRFTEPGEYRYICVPHELAGMVGTVIVEAAGG